MLLETVPAYTQVSSRLTQRLHGLLSSHFTLAKAQGRQAEETRPAVAEEALMRRLF